MTDKIQSFVQLDAWRQSHKLVLAVFDCCKKMPQYDSLRTQMERSALSTTSNIAEGFGRQSFQDKKHFYIMARGSGYELLNQLMVAKDTGRINEEEYNELAFLSLNSTRLIHGLIRSLVKNGKAIS
ncbi:four helix bundle protein [Candidatus Saccharibacteria bacterium]|nr:four helix bundle protein [Candidatus Saccharibacteria bacterium]